MAQKSLVLLFWTWPVLLGLLVWLTKSSLAVGVMDRVGSYLAAKRKSLRNPSGRLVRYWARPAVIFAHFPFAATAPIPNPFLRAGARVAMTPYIVGLITIATIVAVELAVVGAAFVLIFIVWGFVGSLTSRDNRRSVREAPSPLSRIRGRRLVKTGFLGDTPSGTRVDETGRLMKEGFLGDSPSGIRVDEDGRIMEEGFLGDTPTGLRINDDGQLVEEGFFGDTPTGKRIAESGQVVDEGFLGEAPTGYEFKK